jgi:hypothetical protein
MPHKVFIALIFLLLGWILIYIISGVIREAFTPWPQKTLDDFLNFQQSTNENVYQYNLERVQEQATPAEVDELVTSGQWPWSNKTKYRYMDAVNHSTLIRVDPLEAMFEARKKYNEKAMRDKLFWNTPRGKCILGV